MPDARAAPRDRRACSTAHADADPTRASPATVASAREREHDRGSRTRVRLYGFTTAHKPKKEKPPQTPAECEMACIYEYRESFLLDITPTWGQGGLIRISVIADRTVAAVPCRA